MYNLPLNSIIAPIHAVLKVHGIIANVEEHGSLPSARYSVESVDVDVHMNKTDVDQWKKDDGMLCRWKSLHELVLSYLFMHVQISIITSSHMF